MRKTRLTSAVLLACCVVGCGGDGAKDAKKSPAKVDKHPNESDVYQVTLTDDAVRRLQIRTARVERKPVRRHRTLGGDVVIPPGNTIVVVAPVPGTLGAIEGKPLPPPGARVDAGEPLFSIVPILTPERDVATPAERVQMGNARASLEAARITAAGDVQQAIAEVQVAEKVLALEEQLLKDRTGRLRDVLEARGRVEIAKQKQLAAEKRKEVLDALDLNAKQGQLRTMEITAPQRGIIRNLSATRGQTLTAGMPLFEVANLDVLWIRLPVFVGQVDEIDLTRPVTVGSLTGERDPSSKIEPKRAKLIAAPPSANPLSATVDLYFEINNVDVGLRRTGDVGEAFRPGQRVGVTLPLKDDAESLVVPWSAVLRDVNGTAWVYQQTQKSTYRRRRVLVKYVVDNLAVLAGGPEVGTEVVIAGAAELFGTEFGTGK